MNAPDEFFSASEAARRLGVSAKALRLYEARGLLRPLRSQAGWRTYGPEQMAVAAEVVALRALGLSLRQAAAVLDGDAATLDAALAVHAGTLGRRMSELAGAMERLRALRARLAEAHAPEPGELSDLLLEGSRQGITIQLPWPWGGERFELGPLPPLTYLVGPLGSGKTRLAEAIAAAIPGAVFVGLDRLQPSGPIDAERCERAMEWLLGEGANASPALEALVNWIEAEEPSALVFDLVEHGLDQPSQEALIALLRHRASPNRPLVLMTRSTAILDLELVGTDQQIIYCPANHSPPMLVRPYPGAAGYEAVETCLASPEVRRRSEGVVAFRPPAGSA